MVKQIGRQWLPPLVGVGLGVIAGIVYGLTAVQTDALTYIKLIAMAAVPFLFPVLGAVSRKPYSVAVNTAITVHIVLAGYLGIVLGFYNRVAGWDLLMHGLFGVVASAILYMLLLRWNGAALHPFGFHFTLCFGVMGGAAVWEIFEFVCDLTLGVDSQRVQEALALGISPIEDTMTDIVITAVGIAMFYIGLAIKRAAHRNR